MPGFSKLHPGGGMGSCCDTTIQNIWTGTSASRRKARLRGQRSTDRKDSTTFVHVPSSRLCCRASPFRRLFRQLSSMAVEQDPALAFLQKAYCLGSRARCSRFHCRVLRRATCRERSLHIQDLRCSTKRCGEGRRAVPLSFDDRSYHRSRRDACRTIPGLCSPCFSMH